MLPEGSPVRPGLGVEKVGDAQPGGELRADRSHRRGTAVQPLNLGASAVSDPDVDHSRDRAQPTPTDGEAHEVLKRRDSSSRYDSALDWARNAQTIEDLADAGETWVRIGQKTWVMLQDEPGPTTAIARTDGPVMSEARRDDLKGGEILVAPVVLWLLGDAVGRWVHGRVVERRHSRGAQEHGVD